MASWGAMPVPVTGASGHPGANLVRRLPALMGLVLPVAGHALIGPLRRQDGVALEAEPVAWEAHLAIGADGV